MRYLIPFNISLSVLRSASFLLTSLDRLAYFSDWFIEGLVSASASACERLSLSQITFGHDDN